MRIKIGIAFIFLGFQLSFAQDSLEVIQDEVVMDTIVADLPIILVTKVKL